MDEEPFVDATKAAEHLAVSPRYLIDGARRGDLPGYPMGKGKRKNWRFRISELSDALRRTRSSRDERRDANRKDSSDTNQKNTSGTIQNNSRYTNKRKPG
jgi:hypothetical protein